MANGNPYQQIYGGLARGLLSGVRTGLELKEHARLEKADARRAQQQDFAQSLGQLQATVALLEKPYVPPDYKLLLWNRDVMPTLNRLRTGPGTAVDDSALLGTLDEWPDALDGFMKRAGKIFADMGKGDITYHQGLDMLSMLQTEAGRNFDLAPLLQRGRERQTAQMKQHVFDAYRILEDGIQPGEEPLLNEIDRMSPGAIAQAAEILRKERLASAQGKKPTKLSEFTNEKGDRIVTVDVGGQRQQLNLGKTQADATRLRERYARRAEGLQTGDENIDILTPQQAAAILGRLKGPDWKEMLFGMSGEREKQEGQSPDVQNYLESLGIK